MLKTREIVYHHIIRESVLYLLRVGKKHIKSNNNTVRKNAKKCPKLKKKIGKMPKIEVLFYLPCSPIE